MFSSKNRALRASEARRRTRGLVANKNSKDGKPFRVTELFSGIGAQRMSLIEKGIPHDVVATSEIDKYATKSYEAIYGDNPNLGDITKIESVPESDILTYSFPCFAADTPVLTSKGLVNISEVEVGDFVLSHDGRWHKVLLSRRTGTKQVCSYKAGCGEVFRCTPEHKVYARRWSLDWDGDDFRGAFGKPEWISAKKAADSCYVGFPVTEEKPMPEWGGIDITWADSIRPCHRNDLSERMTDPSFWWTIGRYIAGGRTEKKRGAAGVSLHFGKGKAGDIAKLYDTRFTAKKDGSAIEVYISSRELEAFCSQFGTKPKKKRIPEKYMGLPHDLAEALLDGCIDGDGVRMEKGRVTMMASSRELAYDLVRLIAYVHHCPASISTVGGVRTDGDVQYIVKFRKDGRPKVGPFYEDGWIWTPFRFEDEGDEEDVYDLTVEGSSSFMAAGIIVHNCTDLSGANPKKRGMAKGADSRSSLLWEVERLLDDARARGTLPEWLIMENVPAVFSKQNAEDFGAWVDYLDSLGYTSRWGTLNAKDFGTPQNRKRAYMISHLGDDCPDLPVGTGSNTVLGDILENDVPEKYFLSDARLKGLDESNRKEEESGNGFRFKPKQRDEVANTVTTRAGSRKTDNFVYDRCRQIGTVDGMKGFESIKRVYSPDGLAPTCTTGTSGNSITKISDDGMRIRKLTPRETWRLQGFPDWAFDRARDAGISDSQLYHQSGNSIAVPVMGELMGTIDRYDIARQEGRLPKKRRQPRLDDYEGGNR